MPRNLDHEITDHNRANCYSSCVQGACPKWIPDARIHASPQQKPFSIFSLTTFLGGRSLVLTAVISIFSLWSISIHHQNNWLITVLAHVRSLRGNSIINSYLFSSLLKNAFTKLFLVYSKPSSPYFYQAIIIIWHSQRTGKNLIRNLSLKISELSFPSSIGEACVSA